MITRAQRAWAVSVLVLLLVPGAIGFDLWPLTGWRLFSLSRDATQTEWALDVDAGGGFEEIDLERLPLAYRNAAWPLADLAGSSTARRRELCHALLTGVRDVIPAARELRLVREARRMRVDDGDERVSEDREVLAACE